MGDLNKKLAEVAANSAKKLPEEFTKITEKAIQELSKDESVNGLAVGDEAPNFVLPDSKGGEVSLSGVLEQGNVVLSFNRGGW